MIQANKIIEEFTMSDKQKMATIIFVNGEFSECLYNLISSYDYKDWMFLKEVAKRIEAICKEKETAV